MIQAFKSSFHRSICLLIGLVLSSVLAVAWAANVTTGKVVDENNTPISGVVVSDGYVVSTTDANGNYTLNGSDLAKFVFVSIPADCEAPIINGVPVFYKDIKGKKDQKVDFQLRKKPKENNFVMTVMADHQMQIDADMLRFSTEAIDDFENLRATYPNTISFIGFTAGDNTWDNPGLYTPYVKDLERCSYPWFHVIGNHDHDEKVTGNDYESSHNYEKFFGPNYYSFNKGECHFVSLDNIIYNTRPDYQTKITPEQLTWLARDLAYVPKSQLIILGMHSPAKKRGSGGNGVSNLSELLTILNGYNVLIVSGHTHKMNRAIISSQIEEFTMSPTMGYQWAGNTAVDGCPNGYGVFEISGNKLVGQYYKALGREKQYQMNVYPIGMVSAQSKSVVAHVWNFSQSWKVEVFEDEVYKGAMTQFTGTDPLAYDFFIGPDKPVRKPSLEPSTSPVLFYYTPKDAKASIRVVATDQFGRTYSETLQRANEVNKTPEEAAKRQVFFTENMGEGADPAVNVLTWSKWGNKSIAISSGGTPKQPDVRKTVVSATANPTYPECSGENNVYFMAETPGSERGFAMHYIDASKFTDIELSFGYYKTLAGERSALDVYSWDGSEWIKIDFTFAEETQPVGWYRSPILRLPESATRKELALRFVKPASSPNGIRIDDVWLSGVPVCSQLPVVKPIAEKTATSFKAEWEPVPGASSYLLDVSTYEYFTTASKETIISAWTLAGYVGGTQPKPNIYVATNKDKVLTCSASGDSGNPSPYAGGSGSATDPYAVVSTGWQNGVLEKHFQVDIDASGYYDLNVSAMLRNSNNAPKHMKAQYRINDQAEWIDIPNGDLLFSPAVFSFRGQHIDLPLPSACNNQKDLSVRWVVSSSLRSSGLTSYIITSGGTSRIANIYIKGKPGTFISGYESKVVTGTSETVTGLASGKEYFYRVRATDGVIVSNASKTASSNATSSVDQIGKDRDLVVYYQKYSDSFVVEGMPLYAKFDLWIRDVDGRLIDYRKGLEGDSMVSAQACMQGMYLVSVLSEQGLQSFKCLKTN